jgi:nitronate monooxygenase
MQHENPTRLSHLLGIEHPVIQAPMAGTSTPELAAAVSNAGGLGSLGLAGKNAEQVRDVIHKLRALTSKPFNLNFFCHREPRRDAAVEQEWIDYLRPLFAQADAQPPRELSPSYPTFLGDEDMLEVLLKERPPIVSFHFGVPDDTVLAALHDAGIFTLASATNLEEAAAIERAGLKAIIAQGAEAGGHRGTFDTDVWDEQLGTGVLVQLIRRQCELPLIAAGGIMDRAGAQAMFSLGADAVQLGTAFVACPESAAKDAYRAALTSGRPTKLSRVYSGRAARGIVEPFMTYAEGSDGKRDAHAPAPAAPAVPDFPVAYSANKALSPAAAAAGIPGMAPHWAGQGVDLTQAMPAAELVHKIAGA